jgi:hypothetical protein
METKETNHEKASRVLPDALLITALTACVYWIAYRYEAGYLSYFGLPGYLVEVSLEIILFVCLAVSGAVFLIYSVANIAALIWPENPYLKEKIARCAAIFLFPIWHLVNYGFRTKDWPIYAVVLAIVFCFEIIWPLVKYRNKGALKERFIADEAAEYPFRERIILSRILINFGPAAYYLILLFLLGGMFADTAGHAKAMRQKEYLVIKGNLNAAVIRIYNNKIIAVPFDRSSKQFRKEVVFTTLGQDKIGLAIKKDLGPLILEP